MRIPPGNIPTQTDRIPTTNSAATSVRLFDKRQDLGGSYSYTRDCRRTSDRVIDAKNVKFYTQSTQIFKKERQNLDLSFEAESTGEKTAPPDPGNANPVITSYRARTADPPPPPVTYINIFA